MTPLSRIERRLDHQIYETTKLAKIITSMDQTKLIALPVPRDLGKRD
jgi:hypothetical protein